MEDLNALSNEDLKYRLTQFGFANLPVTSTTRKVLIKKLRNHMESEKSKLRRETSYATRYSSDEELSNSDKEKSVKKRGAVPRSTIGPISHQTGKSSRSGLNTSAMPPPSPKRMQSTSWGANNVSPKSKSSVYISPLIQGASDSDEESDSNSANVDGFLNSSFLSRYSSNLSGAGISPRSSLSGTSFSPYNGVDGGGLSDLSAASQGRYSTYTSGLRNRFYGGATDEVDMASQNSVLDRPTTSTNGNHQGEDPAANDFTKRLLSFRTRNMGAPISTSGSSAPQINPSKRFDRFSSPLGLSSSRTLPYRSDMPGRSPNMTRDIVYQANMNTSHSLGAGRKPPPAATTSSTWTNLINKLDEQYGVKQSFVPCALLSSLFIFFTLVVVVYLTMSPDLSVALDAKAATYQLCPGGDQRLTPFDEDALRSGLSCIDDGDLEPAFSLLKRLIPELQERIVTNRCKDSSAPFTMSAKEVIRLMLATQPQSVADTMHALHNAEYLISVNPQWRVAHFGDASGLTVIPMTEVVKFRSMQSNYFGIVQPRLPLTCFLYNKLQTFFIIVGWVGIVLAVAYLIFFAIKFVRGIIQSRRDRLNNMIEDIINVLMQKAYDPDTAATEAATVVVNHLRDKLIPVADRGRLESVWNAAIRYIEANESRVQFTVATRSGEDYRVMRWVDTSMPTSSQPLSCASLKLLNTDDTGGISSPLYPCLNISSGGSGSAASGAIKKWQSPAFDKSNKINDPPTECLKIRQMFDKYEAANPNLKQTIQDAILEKVAHTSCRIYDIQLDKASCCVYVRCATSADAGIIHDEINGWWFDSRLVSIKFLRLPRFLSRFPQSTSLTCLRPSNSKNLSMANCNAQRNSEDGNDDDDYYYNNGRN